MKTSKKIYNRWPKLPLLDFTQNSKALGAIRSPNSNTPDATIEREQSIAVDSRWEHVLSPVVEFKIAIDHIVHAPRAHSIQDRHYTVLAKYGIEWSTLSKKSEIAKVESQHLGLVNTWPDHFFRNFIFGHFDSINEGDLDFKVVGRMPFWTRVGRLWREHHILTSDQQLPDFEVQQKSASIDRDNRRDEADSNGRLYGGIPLVEAGEGRNRYQFYWKYRLDQYVRLRVYSYPAPENLRLQRVPFSTSLFCLHFQEEVGKPIRTCLMPLRDLASPILESYGVTWIPDVWYGYFLPWSKVIVEGKSLRWHHRFQPKRLWRKLVYGG
ncbi:hypothetical protein BCM14_0255 [Jezberella montanilacus]|uniref:Uncharacterized protein n=1 Tax=Jezberella montanilacus TaxID=323426 RepID=A0A2T0XPD5_9BURK|nr:hypothetical protein [Jezberella montanilacus]PRZ00783.1 hypothetical protein BCM14_0255 [Jezberella montanilacus]